MRIIVRPLVDPEREIDLTDRLVSAIAEELWRLYGGNDQLNWIEAERHLERIVGEARSSAAGAGQPFLRPAIEKPVESPSDIRGGNDDAATTGKGARYARSARRSGGTAASRARRREFVTIHRES